MNTYAIGDIHGCAQQLQAILGMIAAREEDREHRIVLLGDYIDRGPASRQVLDLIMQREDIIALVGNHEEMLLDAIETGDSYNFLNNGGVQTLASFGVATVHDIPSPYVDLLRRRLRLFIEDDLRLFVHAGIIPGAPAAVQNPWDLLWVRERFLTHLAPHYKYVVHGHTPQPGFADIRDNRTNLDSGCVFTGVLSCGVFDDTQAKPIEVLTARA